VQAQRNHSSPRRQQHSMISRSITVTTLVASALLSISTAFAQAPAAPAAPAAAVAPKAMPVNAAPAAPATPAAAPAAPAATSKAAPAAKAEKTAATKSGSPNKQFTAKTAKSKECSLKADEQKLKGKARQKFRAECKKAA
jgi:hypothetical protein